MKPTRPLRSPIPAWGLLGVLALALAATFLLIPDRYQILERLERDGLYERALRTLSELSPQDRAARAEAFDLLEIRLRRSLIAQTQPAQEEMLPSFDRADELCALHQFRGDFFREYVQWVKWAAPRARLDERVALRLEQLTPDQQEAVSRLICEAALAADDPGRAASWFDRFWRQHPRRAGVAEEGVRLWRLAAQPERALESLDQSLGLTHSAIVWAQQHPGLARLRLDLLRELGRAEDAYQTCRALFEASPAPEPSLFTLLVETARGADRVAEILPPVEAHARAQHADLNAWRLLEEVALAADRPDLGMAACRRLVELDSTQPAFRFRLAQLLEWNGQPGEAFDHYLAAFELGETDSIARLVALSAGLRREGELAAVLTRHDAPVEAAGFGRWLARLEFNSGEFEVAAERFSRLVEREPQNLDLLREYLQVLSDLFEYERMLALSTRQLASRPNDPTLWRAKAEALNYLRQYPEALAAYGRLVELAPNDEVLNSYLALAEALGQLDLVLHQLHRRLETDQATPRDYLRAASTHYQLNQPRARSEVMRKALAVFPEDPVIRQNCAYALADADDPAAAARVLQSHPALRTDPALIEFNVSLLSRLQDVAGLEQFLGSGLDSNALNQPAILEVRASLAESRNRLDEALALYTQLAARYPQDPRLSLNRARLLSRSGRSKEAIEILDVFLLKPTPEILGLAAQVFAEGRDYRRAEHYQRLYLATSPLRQPQAWGFLGDILLSRGEKNQARAAYEKGIAAYRRQLGPRKQP
jgi:tetratricopeptide (TPR) repeat protein